MGQLVLGGAKGKTISIGAFNEPYGTDLAHYFAQAWKALGGKIEGPVIFDPQATSLDSEASKIVSGNPDGYWIIGDPAVFARLVQSLLRTGSAHPASCCSPTSSLSPPFRATSPSRRSKGPTRSTALLRPTHRPIVLTRRPSRPAGGGPELAFDPVITDSVIGCALAAAAAHSTNPAAVESHILKVSDPPGTKYTFLTLAAAFKAAWAGKDINYQGISSIFDFNHTGDSSQSLFQIDHYKNGKLITGPYTRG